MSECGGGRTDRVRWSPITMVKRKSRTASGLAAVAFAVSGLGVSAPAGAQEQQPAAPAAFAPAECKIDLANPGKMKDIVSNALRLGLDVREQDIRTFLDGAESKYATGTDLRKAAAGHFKLDEAVLAAEVEKFKHINCRHPGGGEYAGGGAGGELYADVEVTPFARDVTLHVVLHELGHALIREFDIPILTNEETAADAFATYYLTTYLPDRAVDVLTARVTSLMIEAGETPEVDWSGEHDDDARRAFQIAALAMAADPLKYKPVAALVGMSEDDIRDARDYGAEIRRSWRRVLGPLWMPDGVASGEARVAYDDTRFLQRLCAPVADGGGGLADEIAVAVRRFDWHSQVTVRFVDGEGGAGWSRSGRNVTVNSAYVRRFVQQGGRGLPGSK
ncbi:MAG: DUF4344 domain-containing metallopeptidase [Phycisphaerales bacterium]